MRAVVQRVLHSSVTVDGACVGEIQRGLNVLLGVAQGDTAQDAKYLAEKIVGLRIFEDEDGKMNCGLKEVGGEVLAISQFTLLGDCRRGKRPSFSDAARPEEAQQLYQAFVGAVRDLDVVCREGIFQADMKVEILNDGPVTLLLDSRKAF